jgi:peptidoglycan/xylan/chitin deacetylase (PgdA/CDA1 family)
MTTIAQALLGASALVTGVAGAATYYATYGVRTQWLGPSDWRGRGDTGSVALTFDDGPTADTERVLDTLAAHDVRATFFMIGLRAERRAATARRVASGGHEIGNHSYSHPIYLYRTAAETYRQVSRAQDAIASSTGVRPIWSRPPCGVRTPAYFRAARALGLRTVQWTVAGFDWKNWPARDIIRHVVSHASAGSIILLHDGDSAGRRDRSETVAAIPGIVHGLRDRGLHITPLRQLL